MEYLSLSRQSERVGINSHWGNGSGTRLRRLEWNGGKKNVKIIYRQQICSLAFQVLSLAQGSKVTLQFVRVRERAWKSRLQLYIYMSLN